MENKMVSLDAVMLFILVLGRVAVNCLLDVAMPRPWALIEKIPLIGTLLSPHGVELLSPGRTDPISLLLVSVAFLLLLIYLLLDVMGVSSYRTKLGITLLLVFFTVIANSLFAVMLRRVGDPWEYAHDGGVLQTEEAIRHMLAGKNPYIENYMGSSLMQLRGPNHFSIFHYPYFPLTFVFPIPSYLLSQRLIGWFDQRFVYLPLFFLTLLLLQGFASDKTGKLLLVMIAGFNPTMGSDLILGMNDSFVFFWIVLSLYLLLNERGTLSAIALGLACASKATAWFLVPFWLLYLCRGHCLSWKATSRCLKLSIPFLLTLLLFLLPFFLWDWQAMMDDIWSSNVGTVPHSFPITGWGFANFVLGLGWVKTRMAYFPFWIPELIVCLPLLAYFLRRQARENTIQSMLIGYSFFLFAFLYFSRFLHGNYMGYILVLFALAYFSERRPSPSEDQ